MWRFRRLMQAVSAASVLAACTATPSASVDAAATPAGYSVKDLAGGPLAALPTGPLYIRVIHFAQPPGHTIHSATHVAGFDYVASGVQRLTITGSPPTDIAPGQSVFQPTVAHTHTNAGIGPNNWYFIALWPATARAVALVDPTVAKVVFETPDLPAGALPPGSYVQTLRVADLEPGGRGPAHQYGGVDLQFVLEGSVSVHVSGQQPVTLGAGEGAYHLPGVGLQEHNAGQGRARYLEMLTTGDGRPFVTSINHPV